MCSSMSTNTGLARTRATTFALAAKLIAGTMTSSPAPTPATSSAISSPAVAEVITRTWRPDPKYAASAASKAWTLGPLASCPERNTSATAAMLSASIEGRAKGRKGFM